MNSSVNSREWDTIEGLRWIDQFLLYVFQNKNGTLGDIFTDAFNFLISNKKWNETNQNSVICAIMEEHLGEPRKRE